MLIEPNGVWPPLAHHRMRYRWESWAAWWSGDLLRLRIAAERTAPGGYWWRRRDKPEASQYHLPLAADIARTSAELVAGDTPDLDWDDDATTTAWDDMAQALGWANRLLEGFEMGAALGGFYLRPQWDISLAPHPLLTVVRADEALPTFRFGQLSSVTFVTEVERPLGWKALSDAERWRWLEHHEDGQIRHELWRGSIGSIGTLFPLTECEATADLVPVVDTRFVRPKGILCDYIPNDLPQPLDVLPLGRSALQGCETLLDALDEAFDSWMRDIRLGKARLAVSNEALNPVSQEAVRRGIGRLFGRSDGSGPAKAFDQDAEVFMPLEMPAEQDGKAAPITPIQFAIRFAEHQATCEFLVEQIVSRAGYAPQTFGINVDGQLSGTAMRRREQRSYRTQGRQRRYARAAMERQAETLMLINKGVFEGPTPTGRPTLQWQEADQSDPVETAQTIEILRRSETMSAEIAVAMAHPEWDEDAVDEEVARIKDEFPAAPPPMTGVEPMPPTVGVPQDKAPSKGPELAGDLAGN